MFRTVVKVLGFSFCEGLHDVGLGFFAESLDRFLLSQITRGGDNGNFLSAWLVARCNFNLGDPCKFLKRRTDVFLTTCSSHAGHCDRISFGAGSISCLLESVHFVGAGFPAERLDGLLLGQITRGGDDGYLLGAWLVTRGNFHFGNTCELLERRTDVFFTACSSDTSHADLV